LPSRTGRNIDLDQAFSTLLTPCFTGPSCLLTG
jgi:hypothetical protein